MKLVFVQKITFVLTSYENRQKLMPPELHFLTPICTKSFVGWGLASDPTGELTPLPRLLAVFRGPTSKAREGEGRGDEERGGRRGSEFVLCSREKAKSRCLCS